MKSFILLGAMACAAVGSAVVVPNAYAGTEGDGTFALTSTAAAGRTYQMTIAASQLTALVGQSITGMRFRLNGAVTANWPSVSTNYSQWDVFMGAGVAPSAMSNTFASNFLAGSTQVRSGALTFGPNSFTAGSSPNAFGQAITFNSGYVYTGGDLAVEMRFSGQTGNTTTPSFDAVLASGGPANGWGVGFAGRWTSSITGTTGGNGNFLVTDFVSQPVPEPATMAALGLGGLALLRRRRK